MPTLTTLKAKSMAAAKLAKCTPQEATAGMRNARRVKLLKTVDPKNEYSEAERNRRADALLKAQMLALTDAREKKRAAKAQAADQVRYDAASAALPHGCAYCGPIGRYATHRTCERHAQEMQATWE